MFCKCFFAALWELAHGAQNVSKINGSGHSNPIVPRLRIEPIFLPAVSYLVETDGYVASCLARFQQARRHCQGVVELGYVLLQYTRLSQHAGFFKLPLRTHARIMSIAVKMHTVHITAPAQAVALLLATVTTFIPSFIRWVLAGGLHQLFVQGGRVVTQLLTGFGALDAAQQALAASVGNISCVAFLYSVTSSIVVSDLIEGRYYREVGRPSPARAMLSVKEVDEKTPGSGSEDSGDSPERDAIDVSSEKTYVESVGFLVGKMSWCGRFMLFQSILADTSLGAYPMAFICAVIPEILAAHSLLRRGTDFEYIVAEKPE